jgi:two-component sensor histidine kinase
LAGSAADHNSPADSVDFGKNLAIALVLFALGAAGILIGQVQSPIFHTILDTSAFLSAGLIALLLWDISKRTDQPLAWFLAIAFGVVAAAELVHTGIALERLSWETAAEAEIRWRAGSWGPSAYIGAIGVGTALLLRVYPRRVGGIFALALILLYAALFVIFQTVPRYMLPGFFGITRPTLIGAPLLWACVAFGYWRLEKSSQVAHAAFASAVVMAIGHCFMLFSQPADDPTAIVGTGMVAHFGKVTADLLMLLSLTQIGAADTARRLSAEAELIRLNRDLEQHVAQRTAELVAANARLSQALEQRDLLLREVYHRVKNNLQLIDSICTLQARRLADPEAKTALKALRRRLYALGLVHQQLMSSADLKTFDVSPFLMELSENIIEGTGHRDIRLSVNAIPLYVGLDFAIPLGLLVTELVTNSLKHAFPDGKGKIEVVLDRKADGTMVLVVSDDGAGYDVAEASRKGKTAGLGTTLIDGLVSQLRAVINVRRMNGTISEVLFAQDEAAS